MFNSAVEFERIRGKLQGKYLPRGLEYPKRMGLRNLFTFSRKGAFLLSYPSLKEEGKIMLGIFLDLETTGLDSKRHRIIEIAFKITNLHTGEVLKEYESVVSQPKEVWDHSDPISLQVNGFTWDRVQEGKPEELVSQEVLSYFKEQKIRRGSAVYICQNPSFDRNFFSQLIDIYTQEEMEWPYHWLDLASMNWALQIKQEGKDGMFPRDIPLSKDKIAACHKLPPEAQPHKAMNGVNHLFECYDVIVGFPEGGNNV